MGTWTTRTEFVPNTPANADEVNGNFEDIETILNGNIDANNLAADAVTNAKLADDAVEQANIADGAITAAHFGAGAIDAAIGTASARTIGTTTAVQAAAGNHGHAVVSTAMTGTVTSANTLNGTRVRLGNGTYPLTLTLPAKTIAGVWMVTVNGAILFTFTGTPGSGTKNKQVYLERVTDNTSLGTTLWNTNEYYDNTGTTNYCRMAYSFAYIPTLNTEEKLGLAATIEVASDGSSQFNIRPASTGSSDLPKLTAFFLPTGTT